MKINQIQNFQKHYKRLTNQIVSKRVFYIKLQLLIINYKNQIYLIILLQSTINLMSSDHSDIENIENSQKRKKRGQSKFSRQTPKYQCFCDKIYLSYPALYLHLKNKHPEHFLNNRKIQVTKFKQEMTEDGFKIFKMEKTIDDINSHPEHMPHDFQNKQKQGFPYPPYSQFPFPNRGSNMPPFPINNYYMGGNNNNKSLPFINNQNYNIFNHVDSQKQRSSLELRNPTNFNKPSPILQKSTNLVKLLNKYFNEKQNIQQLNQKEKLQLQILFQLIIKCIKQRTQQIKSFYQKNQPFTESTDYINSQNIKFLEFILPYFRKNYINLYIQKIKQKIGNNMNLQKNQKSFHLLFKNSRYFVDVHNSCQEIIDFQNWLIQNHFIQKVEDIPNV